MFGSNVRLDLVFTEGQWQPKSVSQQWPHDLRFKFANRRNGSGFVARASGTAWLLETGPCPKLAETLPAVGRRRHCSAEFGFSLVFLATGHDGDGRILQLPPPAAGCAPDWLFARAAIRRRIPRSACAWHSLFPRGRAFIGGGVLP